MISNKSYAQRLQEAYEKAKKPLAYSIIILIFLIGIISRVFDISETIKPYAIMTLLVLILFIIVEILFAIYEKVVSSKGSLKIIKPNHLYDEIINLIKNEKNVNIKCIGVAGRFGWYSVISRLLDKRNDDSLHEANSFNIEMALISTEFLGKNDMELERFDALIPVIDDIKRSKKRLETMYPHGDKRLELYHYCYIPNFVGFLINDNYLFFNFCYWEEISETELYFRGAGTEYIVYDKNDDFGGSRYIERFSGWFSYIKSINNKDSAEIHN